MRTSEAIERLARFVGARLIFDEQLSGSVSIEASEPLGESEAAAMIDALLLMKGFAAVKGPGGARKVVPIANAQGPWLENLPEQPDETPLVTLVRLRDIDAELVQIAIAPLIGTNSIAHVHHATNGILLAGAGNRLRRLADVMQALDDEGLRRLVLIPLRYADAETTGDVLMNAVNDLGGDLRVWPDVRTNRLVVRGRPDVVERARSIVDRIDRPAEGEGNLQVIPVRYMDAEQLAESLRALATAAVTSGVRGGASLAGRPFAVSVHGPSHSLVVQADPETIDIVRGLVAELDRVPPRVEVEVIVAEVSHLDTLNLALDAILPIVEPNDVNDLLIAAVSNPGGNALATSAGGGVVGRIAQTPLLVPIVNPLTGLPEQVLIPRATGVLAAEEREIHSRVLLRPRLSMISGEEHEIFAGENIPVPTAEVGDTGSNLLQTRQTIERRDTGVILRVQPTVFDVGPIVLDLYVEVSRFAGTTGNSDPIFSERTLTATARLQSGLTAVVGWASLPTTTRREVGTPYLSRIPILGALFRSSSEIALTTHLLIAVRAERDRPEAVVLTNWLRRELADRERPVAAATSPEVP
jgi:general secretion pathway protein D